MHKKNKGLADNQDGEIILNESGTSLTFDQADENTPTQEQKEAVDENNAPEKTDPGVGHA